MTRVREGTEGLEKSLRRYVAEQLRARGCLVYAIETETVKGLPDLLAVLPTGMFLGLEIKKKGGTLSKVQQTNLEEIRKRNGVAEMIASRDAARRLFRRLGLPKPSGAKRKRLRQASTPSSRS